MTDPGDPDGDSVRPPEGHACVPYAPTTSQAPNLIVWNGDRHVLALELKDADAVPERPETARATAA
jgi:hypothetical protein